MHQDAKANASARKLRGAWYTPVDLVDRIVEQAIDSSTVDRCDGRPVRVVDPACGDGRFLRGAANRVRSLGGSVELVGCDIDPSAVAEAGAALASTGATVVHDDALTRDWSSSRPFDVVIGNPPFLSQMAAATTRGGSSARGGGPYADAAAEFLALAIELVAPDGGRVAYVLPQSILSARDARSVRNRYDAHAELMWSWWTGEREFDASVLTCALLFEFGTDSERTPARGGSWSHVITSRTGVPEAPTDEMLQTRGTLGDRARLNANFRDEYYGMVPAVGDHEDGPPLITSGLIDPGRSLWGDRPVRFAKQRFERPRIDLGELDAKMARWAAIRLVPKVLIANQTKIIEAVADPSGSMLPGVPVVAAYPNDASGDTACEIAAVLTSPFASVWAWHRSGGSGLSANAIRLGPVLLAALPWPAAELREAVTALRQGETRRCALEVHRAYGLDVSGPDHETLMSWWSAALSRIEARQPA